VQHQPAERPLDRPPLTLWLEPALLGVFGHHLHIDPMDGSRVVCVALDVMPR
jgi:hypothetical protein